MQIMVVVEGEVLRQPPTEPAKAPSAWPQFFVPPFIAVLGATSNSCTRASTASSSGRLSFASSEIISFALTEGELFELTLDESELHVNLTPNPGPA